MIESATQAKFSKSCADAALGYTIAGCRSYAMFAEASASLWQEGIKAMSAALSDEPAKPKSWYREPPREMTSSAAEFNPFLPATWPMMSMFAQPLDNNPWTAWMSAFQQPAPAMAPLFPMPSAFFPTPTAPFNFMQPTTDPVRLINAWWGMFPLQGPTTAWPMAYSMMTYGMPKDIAWPAATANAAAIEAAQTAAETMEKNLSTYRSSGGHAVAQVVTAGPAVLAMMMAPFSEHLNRF